MFLILPLHPSHSATVAPLRGKRLSPGRPGLQAACAEPSVSGGFHWGDGSLPGSNSSVPEFWWHRLQGPGVEEAAAGSLDEAEVCCQLGRPCALSFPGGSESKESTYNAGDLGSIPGLGKSPGEGNGNPVQYSGLENSMDRGAWQATVQAVAKSWMGPRDFHHHLCFGGEAPLRTVFWPGESHGWRSLVGYSPRGCKESETTEPLHFHFLWEGSLRGSVRWQKEPGWALASVFPGSELTPTAHWLMCCPS